MNKIVSVISIIGALNLSGCISSHYVQKSIDQSKPESYAVVEGNPVDRHVFGEGKGRGMYQQMLFTGLDGKTLYTLKTSVNYPDKLMLAEGVHSIDVSWRYAQQRADSCVWVNAKKGHTYYVNRSVQDQGVQFWLVDALSNDVVGGLCGSEPEY